ncbi:MAG TPA: hypothetical protein VFS43_44545 [Polyangiaceae bacterium]|nr:hypothetical protein [Polyangiaceae bacterium]
MPLLVPHGPGAGNTARPWLALPLALFGATVLAALYRQRVARLTAAPPRGCPPSPAGGARHSP